MRGYVWGAAAAGLLISGLYMLPDADARGETRTMTLYSVNTKEKLTTTYMVNGRHVPAELKKINHLLRDWRRDAVTKMDTETIDLMWELHADLGSRAPIHIISGYRSAETNAMLKNIGRNVAKKSMHIQGKAIDLYFPDVSTERLRNSALVREIGGVGYYPRSGASGFIHVDSGRVRHWPGISSTQMAKIRRDYSKTIGARLSGDRPVQVASAETADQGYPIPTPRPRPIEVLMMAAAEMVVQPASAPAPVNNFADVAARQQKTAAADTRADMAPVTQVSQTKIDPKADLALAQLNIEPVAARPPSQNFAARPSPVRDTLDTALEPEYGSDLMLGRIMEKPQPKANADAGSPAGFLTALRDGIAAGAKQLIDDAESLIWGREPSQTVDSASDSGTLEAAREPFPPITDEDAAELEVIIAALRSRAEYDALSTEETRSARSKPAVKGDRMTTIRARKGDLILTPVPQYRRATLESAPQRVNQAAVKAFEKLLKADDKAE